MVRRIGTVALQSRHLLPAHSERIRAQDSHQKARQLGPALLTPHVHSFGHEPLNILVEILQLRPQQDLRKNVVPGEMDS